MERGTLYSQEGASLQIGGASLSGICQQTIAIGTKCAKTKDAKDDIAALEKAQSDLDKKVAEKREKAVESIAKIINVDMRLIYSKMKKRWETFLGDSDPEVDAAAKALRAVMKNITAVFTGSIIDTVGNINGQIVAFSSLDPSVIAALKLESMFGKFEDLAEQYCSDYSEAINNKIEARGDKTYEQLKENVRICFSTLYSTLECAAKHGKSEETLILALRKMWKTIKAAQATAAAAKAKAAAKKKAADEAKKSK